MDNEVMLDASEPITAEDHEIIESVNGIEHIIAINKIDKPAADPKRVQVRHNLTGPFEGEFAIELQAVSGTGNARVRIQDP